MLLFDIMRNIIFLPLVYIMDYDIIEEDKNLKEQEEKEFHEIELQIAI